MESCRVVTCRIKIDVGFTAMSRLTSQQFALAISSFIYMHSLIIPVVVDSSKALPSFWDEDTAICFSSQLFVRLPAENNK